MKLLSAFFFLSVFAFISHCAIEKSNFRSSLLTNKNKSGIDENLRFRISLPTIRFPSSAVETNVTNKFGNIQAPIKIEKTLFPLLGSSSRSSNYINSSNNRNEYDSYKETDPSSQTVIPSLLNAVYLFSSICFILCLRGLSNHKTSKRGNLIGCIGIIAAITVTCSQAGFGFRYSLFLFITIPALLLGFFLAKNVNMFQMPQLVALFHSFVGLSALLVGFSKFHSSFFRNSEMNILHLLELYIGTFIAAITFIGSLVASGKLSGLLENKSLKLKEKKMINILCIISLVLFGYYFVVTESFFVKTCCLYTSFVIELFLGFHLIASIGGADMPVVISALNSYSGFATALSGFLLNNSLLIISGALIGSSGAILSYIMCVSMNRNIGNIILGGWDDDEEEEEEEEEGAEEGAEEGIKEGVNSLKKKQKKKQKKKYINTITYKSTVDYLINANKVVIVPGYGVAVSKCQRELSDICTILKGRNINVSFAIHPVAGRMPGHLNVLLAESNVPYNLVKEMEEVNATISEADIVLVIGANDTVNPASFDANSKIFGMPVIEVWKAKKVIILKRSLATGYSNIDNPLFYYDNSYLLFGDAKYTTNQMLAILNDYVNITQTESNLFSKQKEIKTMKETENNIDSSDNKVDLKKQSDSSLSLTESSSTDMTLKISEENFPKPRKILGLLKENGIEKNESKESVKQKEVEQKDSMYSTITTDANLNTVLVPVIPKFIPKLRKMGFRVFVEKEIGKNILIEDEEYIKYGAEIVTREEVLQQSNIILKVDPPKEELISTIPNNTVFISYIWPGINTSLLNKMIENKEEKQNITYIAIDEVPRTTRAQKLDIRSSMSNLQGYRSVLEAFYMLPRFSKASTTAAGKIKPAKVFVIGAGVAGLQAIITAKSLGAIVYAHDSRLSTEEEVKSCGGIFVKIPTKKITKENTNEIIKKTNVYAKEMDEEYLQMQTTLFKKIIKKCDIVICSASIPGKKSPKLITTEMIQLMKPGSVAVDLATEFGDKENNWGGNIECSISNKNRIIQGVHILGRDKIERNMPIQASELFSLNILNLLEEMGQGLHFNVDMNNDIIKSMVVVTNGNIVYSEEKSQLLSSKQSESIFASKQDELFDDMLPEEKLKKYTQQDDYIYPHKLKSFTQKLFDSDFLFFIVLFIVLALVCFFGTVLSITDLQHLFLLSLSLIVGYYCVWSVTPSLHTPLISVTNALSGVIIIGSMIEYGNGLKDVSTIFSLIATFLAALNLSGGFYVTKRMLDMFTK